MVDPHHLAGAWQSCDLDLVAKGQKQLQARVMSPDLGRRFFPVGWVQQGNPDWDRFEALDSIW